MSIDVARALEKNDTLTTEKAPWNPQWQLIAEYLCQRKAVFTNFQQPGAFLNSEIWSDIGGLAAETAASALIGLIWPDAYSFELEPFGELKDDPETVEWFKKTVNPELQSALDDPEAGFAMALDEAMLDFLLFMPAIHLDEGDTTDFKFDAWNVSQFAVDEGADGFIDTFYMTKEWSVRNLVKKFGLSNVSKPTQTAYNAKKFLDKIRVLHVIEPREVQKNGGRGPQNMPFVSAYIEINAKHLIRESGFNELPTFAFRFSKRIGEKYARTPAMRALPSIMEHNALKEIYTVAAEKTCDLPLAVYDDGTFGGGTIDTSAGAINVINVTGKLTGNRAPIEPIQTIGTFTDIATVMNDLKDTINQHFMIDRLLDMNNETQMTAREALIRDALRQGTLRSPASRLWAELFNRLLPRAFNIQLRKGRYGYVSGSPEYLAAQHMNPGKTIPVIPDKVAMMQGKSQRVYKISYRSPAARQQKSDQAQAILNVTGFINEAAAIDQTVRYEMNMPRSVRNIGDIWGIPPDCWSTLEEKKKLIADASDSQKQNTQLETAAKVASIAKDAGASSGKLGAIPNAGAYSMTGL